jgi:hypothetical protein
MSLGGFRMSYTIEELEKKSDRQIDYLVAEKHLSISTDKDIQRMFQRGMLKYCNSWADIGVIISNYGICLMSPIHKSTNDKWEASWNESGGRWNGGDIRFRHKNPLRAAAIVYLMIGEEK